MVDGVLAATRNWRTTGVSMAPGQTWAMTADGIQAWMAGNPTRGLYPLEENNPVPMEDGKDSKWDPQVIYPLGEDDTLTLVGEVSRFEDLPSPNGDTHMVIVIPKTKTEIIVKDFKAGKPREEAAWLNVLFRGSRSAASRPGTIVFAD